jgi:hypothetical protein
MWLKVVADAGVTTGTELEEGTETALGFDVVVPEFGAVATGFKGAEGVSVTPELPLAEGVLVPVCTEVVCELVFTPAPAPLPQASVSAARQIATDAPAFPLLNLCPANRTSTKTASSNCNFFCIFVLHFQGKTFAAKHCREDR